MNHMKMINGILLATLLLRSAIGMDKSDPLAKRLKKAMEAYQQGHGDLYNLAARNLPVTIVQLSKPITNVNFGDLLQGITLEKGHRGLMHNGTCTFKIADNKGKIHDVPIEEVPEASYKVIPLDEFNREFQTITEIIDEMSVQYKFISHMTKRVCMLVKYDNFPDTDSETRTAKEAITILRSEYFAELKNETKSILQIMSRDVFRAIFLFDVQDIFNEIHTDIRTHPDN